MSKIIGMIGNVILLEPLYAGDYVHEAIISDYTKHDFIARGVKQYNTKEEAENSFWKATIPEYFQDEEV